MALIYLGSLTVGTLNPRWAGDSGALVAKLNVDLVNAQGAVAALNLTPPTIALSLDVAQRLVAGIEEAIALGVEVPSLSVQVAAYTAIIASINLQIADISSIDQSAGGIHAYAYDGQANGLGPALPSALPGGEPADHVNALVLATSLPASWFALGQVIKTA